MITAFLDQYINVDGMLEKNQDLELILEDFLERVLFFSESILYISITMALLYLVMLLICCYLLPYRILVIIY